MKSKFTRFDAPLKGVFNWSASLLALFTLVCFASPIEAQVSGTVFRDYNHSGTRTLSSPAEPGERGITVTAYKPDGSTVVATTDASGNYSFTAAQIPSGLKVRLEFTGMTGGTFAAALGSGSATAVQFITAPSTVANFGVADALEFCQTAPDLYTPCYVSGNPLIAGTAGPMDAMVKWNYSYTGTSPSPTHLATAAEVGSVWGMAYQRESKKLFSATILKRHVGLGSLGIGGIYLTDLNTNTITPYVNLSSLGVTLASATQLTQLNSRNLPSNSTSSSSDPNVLGMVGKVGLGGMDISPDGKTLWVMNVYEKKLVSVTIGNPAVTGGSITAANVAQFSVPNPGCTNGTYRPWAVKYYRGKIYVGVVCDASTAGTQANLFAHVYVFDPTTSTFSASPIFSTTLNYSKGAVHTGDAALGSKWEPWRDAWSDIHAGASSGQGVRSARVQPIFSALEFDTDGSLILGFMDRGGHQLGFKQQAVPNNGQFYNGYIGGDILRAQFNVGAGTYTLESNGSSGSKVGCGVANGEGPGNGEFFCADNYPSSGSIIHEETFMGALAIIPGSGELTAMSMDPLAVWSGGPNYMSLNNGSNVRRYNIYTTVNGSGGQVGLTQGKANGLGMIAVGCNPAPIEIGNYVWSDTDGDGVQDPTEPAISGITVELLKANVVIATAVTDGSGRYIFSNKTGTSTTSFRYGITQLLPDMAYEVRVPNVAGGGKQSALGNRTITLANNDPSTDGDVRDSDGALTGSNAVAAVTTTSSGANNHSLDFGFQPSCTLVDAGLTVTCDDNGTPNTSLDDRFTITLNPTGTVLGTTYSVSGAVTAGPINYGTPQQVGGFFNISGGSLLISITDGTDASCKLNNVLVNPPNACSFPPLCLADAPKCGTDPGTGTILTEMDDFWFTNGTGTDVAIKHTVGPIDLRYTLMSSDGTFSTEPAILGSPQTPLFGSGYIPVSAADIGDGTFGLVITNNTGATSMISKAFSDPVTNLQFSIYEIDQSDVVTVTGYLKGAAVTNPTLTAISGTPGFSIAGNVATGSGLDLLSNSANGVANVSFGTQRVDSVKINITGSTALYRLATGDVSFTYSNAPNNDCSAALARLDWNAAGVAFAGGDLDQTFSVTSGGETTDFTVTTTGNTAHLSAGSPAEASTGSLGGFFELAQPSLQILADPTVSSSTITTIIKLSTARSSVRFSIGDIDNKTNNRDQVKVQGYFHGALVKPYFRSDYAEGASFAINDFTAQAVLFNSDASGIANIGTLNVYFPGAVDSIAIMFSESSGVANPVQRELRISDILFCSVCEFRAPETNLTATTYGGTTGGGFTTQYALTQPDGTILDIQNSPSFTGTFNPGGYSIYPVNYSGSIANFAIGGNINAVVGDCVDASKLQGCNLEVCLPLCNQLVSVSAANACEDGTQNAVITHLAAPGQLALYYSSNSNLTAAQLYDVANHVNNDIIAVNTSITPTGTSTTVPMTLPAGNHYLYTIFAASNPNYIPPYCLAMVKTATLVTIFEQPVANAGVDQSMPAGSNVILTATGGGTYAWSTLATTQSITVSPTSSTTYTVTVTQNGCTDEDEVMVTVLPPVADAGEDLIICQGESTVLTGRGGGTYQWSNSAGNTQMVTVSPSVTTTYTVTVTVGAQTSTDEVTVTVITDIPTATVSAAQNICSGQSVNLSASGGDFFAWQPNYPDSSAMVTVTPPNNATTIYTVEVWKNGCVDLGTISVTNAPCPCTGTDLGGAVWQDFNNNGVQDANETVGVDSVLVKIYDCTGALVDSVRTDVDGNWFVDPAGITFPVRVEFSDWPTKYKPTANGTDGRTDVQMITAAECNVDFGLVNPVDYCQTNPNLLVPCHVNGQLSAGAPNDAMIRFPYNSPTALNKAMVSTTAQIGTTWGIAYKRSTKQLFAASFLKRHSAMGPSGPGAIYLVDPNGTANGTLFFDLNTVESVGAVPDNTARGLATANPFLPNTDASAFGLVAEVALGDIDITEDEQYLYTINLASKKLYRLPTVSPSAGNIVSWPITGPSCTGGEWRPFALKVKGDKVYIGGVCDASTSQNRNNLSADVYEFDPASGTFTNVLSFPLTFKRGHVTYFGCASSPQRDIATQWNPWTDVHTVFADCGIHDVYPQPVLSDIEFDTDGSMILGFFDRWGHQTGEANNYPNGVFGEQGVTGGDIMRAYNNSGVFQIENNGVAGALTVGGTLAENNYNAGPGSPVFAPDGQGRGGREFYYGDTWAGTHDERSMGSLALLPGSGQVVMTAMDAEFVIYSGGVIWLDNNDGTQDRAFTIYSGGVASFGKGYALGDIELQCDALPIEVGSYLWVDTDLDGTQDACETPLSGVTVELFKKDGTLVGRTVSGANGEYYFNKTNVDTIAPYGTGGFTGLNPNTPYYVVIGGSQFNTTIDKIVISEVEYSLTTADSGEGIDPDQNDSDFAPLSGLTGGAAALNTYPGYCITTPQFGSNHTYDAGFMPCVKPSATFSKVSASCSPGAAPLNNGSISIATASNLTHYGVSSLNAGSYDGPLFIANAQVFSSAPAVVLSTVPNTGGTYIVRLFNGDSGCFLDSTVVVKANECPPLFLDPCTCHVVVYDNVETHELLDYFEITDGPGKNWQVISGTGMELIDPLFNVPFPYPSTLTYNAMTGKYRIGFAHTANVGYTAVLSDGTYTFNVANTCYKFDPSPQYYDSVMCSSDVPLNLPAAQPNFTMTYYVNSTSNPPITVFDPALYAGQSVKLLIVYVNTNPNSCPMTIEHGIRINPSPDLEVKNDTICKDVSIDLADLVVDDGGGVLSYHTTLADAENGANALGSSVVTPVTATHYYIRSVTGTGINACPEVKRVTVYVRSQSECGQINTTKGGN